RIGMAFAAKHRSPAFAKRDGNDVRKNRAIAPHTRPGRLGCVLNDSIALRNPASRRKIVANVQRTGTIRAKRLWPVGGNSLFATRTFEMADFRHGTTIAARTGTRQVEPEKNRRKFVQIQPRKLRCRGSKAHMETNAHEEQIEKRTAQSAPASLL